MNRCFLVLLFLINGIISFGAIADTVYYQANFVEADTAIPNGVAYAFSDSIESNGPLKFYYCDSHELFAVISRSNKDFTGVVTTYYEDGTVKRKGALKKGKSIGIHEYFDVSGEFQRADIYHYRKGLVGQYYYSESGKKVYSVADRLSSFGKKRNEIKALNELGKYVNANLEKSVKADDFGDPKVLVSFLIAPDGTLEEVHIAEGLHPELDAAAIRLVEQMPAWRPAKFQGENVYSEFSLSIRF